MFFSFLFSLDENINIEEESSQVEIEDKILYYGEQKKYVLVERTNLRRYDNGKYTGLTSREVRSYVNPIEVPENVATEFKENSWFSGNFMVFEATKSANILTAKGLDKLIPTTFHISPKGKLTVVPKDNGYPTFRSFPSYPEEEIKPGDSWIGTAIRTIDPLNKGIYTKLQMTVQYKYIGKETYKGTPVFHIKANWATRYGDGTLYHDWEGDENLIKATGKHEADIMVSIETGAAILIKDQVDETFTYDDGITVTLKGSILLFTEFPPSIDRTVIIPALEKIASVNQNKDDFQTDNKLNESYSNIKDVIPSTKNDMVFEETASGLRLSIRNLLFVPDSSELLPSEQNRLDEIAKVLKLAPSSTFLVEGHSASTGNPSGEKKLSLERAKTIVDALVKRGIPAKQFIFIGCGSENPIADNNTSEGKAVNRRVEITILE